MNRCTRDSHVRIMVGGPAADVDSCQSFTLRWCLLAAALSVCGAVSPGTPALALSTTSGLFIDTDATRATAFEPQIARSRFVKVDLGLLIDETGRSRNVKEIRLNLFPDVVHQGVIVRTESNGDGYSWVGYLEGAENSSLTMISTGGAFIGRFTSPLEAYEVSGAGDGLYLIVEINQSHYPGGDENGTHEAH